MASETKPAEPTENKPLLGPVVFLPLILVLLGVAGLVVFVVVNA